MRYPKTTPKPTAASTAILSREEKVIVILYKGAKLGCLNADQQRSVILYWPRVPISQLWNPDVLSVAELSTLGRCNTYFPWGASLVVSESAGSLSSVFLHQALLHR